MGLQQLLNDAIVHARGGDDVGALSTLLEAWRVLPSARIAELIAAIDGALARPVIEDSSQRARHVAWFAIEAAGDPADVPRLERAIADGYPARCRERIVRLCARPADPRIGNCLIELLRVPPTVAWTRSSSRALWTDLFEGLARHVGPAQRRALGGLRLPFSNEMDRFIARHRERIVGDDVEPVLGAGEAAACDVLATRYVRVDRGPELLAAIYANPGDRAARAVYADWLIECGDPRGELIALQLARPGDAQPSKRERQLLAAHRTAWLGGLGARLQHAAFGDGFLAVCSIRDNEPFPLVAELATVEELRGRFEQPGWLSWLCDPSLRALRRVATVSWDGLCALGRWSSVLGFVEITVWMPRDRDGTASVTPSEVPADSLPDLRRLVVAGQVGASFVAAAARGPLFRSLRELRIGYHTGTLAAWIEMFAGASFERLTLSWNQFWTIEMVRDGGVSLNATVVHGGYGPETGGDERMRYVVSGWLSTEPVAGGVTAVEIVDARWYGERPDSIVPLAAELERITGASVLVVAAPRPALERRRRPARITGT